MEKRWGPGLSLSLSLSLSLYPPLREKAGERERGGQESGILIQSGEERGGNRDREEGGGGKGR